MNPCAPQPHRPHRIVRRAVHRVWRRSVDCDPHVHGIARALRAALVAGGLVTTGAAAGAASIAWERAPVQPVEAPSPLSVASVAPPSWGFDGGSEDVHGAPPPSVRVPEPSGVWVLAVAMLGIAAARAIWRG